MARSKTILSYTKPTPKNFRKLGDALLSIGGMATGYAAISENKFLTITFLIVTVAGKFLTNFFAEEE